jgi:urea carboxylase system permease
MIREDGVAASDTDSRDLAQLGYKQELDRSLGSFSSFAAGFSYISILTGMFQTSYLGFLFAGRAFIWAWPVVLFGQMMVALQFAELSAHYPLAGSIYQWSKKVAGRDWSWNNGWIYLCAQIVTVPAVAVGWQVILPQISTSFQLIKCSPVGSDTCPDKNFPTFLDPAFAKNGLLLGFIMVGLTTLINCLGVRILSTINNVGVAAELIGATGLIILYMIHIQNGPSVLFQTDGTGAGHKWGYFGALLIGAIMPLYVMYGFDTAGSLAEETSDPRKKAPRAVIQALATAGIMGFLLICFGIMAVSDSGVANLGVNGLAGITTDVLGENWGKVFLVDVAVAIFVCCLAIHAMSVRILFAMGRDNALPFGRQLASVSGSRRVPIVPALTTGVIAILILAFNWYNARAFTIIISLGIILMYIAYLMLTTQLYRRRQEGWPANLADAQDGLFNLGGWARVTNIVAILYGLSMIINLMWPREEYYGTLWYQKWGPVLFTVLIFALGLAIYYGGQRDKVGVLSEHQAEAVAVGD